MDAFTTAFGFFILVALASIPLGGLILCWLIEARQGQRFEMKRHLQQIEVSDRANHY